MLLASRSLRRILYRSGRRLGTRTTHVTPDDRTGAEIETAKEIVTRYRCEGHLAARLDPLNLTLSPGLSKTLPELEMGPWSALNSAPQLTVTMASIYSGNTGYEISHIESAEERHWLYDTIEQMSSLEASPTLRLRLGHLLIESEVWDHFMAKRFGQVKRYGLEGGEALMVAAEVLLQSASSDHLVFGMAHRGRINLMVGLLGYPAEAVFHKLGGNSELPSEWSDASAQADVLSHLSHTTSLNLGGRAVSITMLPNPSHLEAVNPVQLGVVYGLQTMQNQPNALAVQIHGDAAFNGQGVVQESLQLSQLPGFAVGGTIHIITNNQLGYTAFATLGRSARYASAPAKMIDAPIIHVNGEYPEDVARATILALRYREKFKKDVIIDLVCYRRHGHNELDEPGFTQPVMYRAIAQQETLPMAYSKKLVESEVATAQELEKYRVDAWQRLDDALKASTSFQPSKFGIQKDLQLPPKMSTGAELVKLEKALKDSVYLPPNFNVHGRLQKYHIEARLNGWREGKVDWSTAEALAIGTLLQDRYNVRLVGQDVQRGTFSQRHLVFTDQDTGETITPFTVANSPTSTNQMGKLEVYNSLLSENGVVGFEYGVSVVEAERILPIWEAQFGDFFNGAQVIFDTFISSGRSKWGFQSALTILLPHGYDGTGPEHSSSRLERFLQMSNAPFDPRQSFIPNWHVVHPTTPANYFHLLRRQVCNEYRRPLIVASPKILLRLPEATSHLDAFLPSQGFIPLLDDPRAPQGKATTLVFCSGKFWYELEKERSGRHKEEMAIVRIEELCPLPTAALEDLVASYGKGVKRFVWCQEEHQNMGPYAYIQPRLQALLPKGSQLEYVGRSPAAAPAAGYSKLHKQELNLIFANLFL